MHRNITISEGAASRLVVLLNKELRAQDLTQQYRQELNELYKALTGGDHETVRTTTEES